MPDERPWNRSVFGDRGPDAPQRQSVTPSHTIRQHPKPTKPHGDGILVPIGILLGLLGLFGLIAWGSTAIGGKPSSSLPTQQDMTQKPPPNIAPATFQNEQRLIEGLAWSQNGKYLAAAYKAAVNIWDVRTQQKIQTYKGTFQSVAWSPDGTKIAACIAHAETRILNVAGQTVLTINEYAYESATWSPDGNYLALSGNYPKIVDAQTGDVIRQFDSTTLFAFVKGIIWSDNNTVFGIASGLSKDYIVKWDIQTGTASQLYEGEALINTFTLSPHGEKMVLGEGDAIKIIDAHTGSVLVSSKTNSSVRAVAWSPDGTLIASGGAYSSSIVQISNAETGKQASTSKANVQSWEEITAIVWSPDSTAIAVGSDNGLVQIIPL